jgi:hypothetical protein
MSPTDAPTLKQHNELRRLAQRTGTSFTPPKTRSLASAEITRMRALKPSGGLELERRLERDQARRGLQIGSRDATRIGQSEVTGYGSTATWR